MKGNIKLSNNIYKMSSRKLNKLAHDSYSKENRKVALNCHITIKKDKPINITISSASNIQLYKDLKINYTSDVIPLQAKTRPIDKNTIISQFSKTSSTPYVFKKLEIDLDHNLFIPKLSTLNDLRRTVLSMVEQYAIKTMRRTFHKKDKLNRTTTITKNNHTPIKKTKISILLNNLNKNFDYSKIDDIENVYIPLKYFSMKDYKEILHILDDKFNLYI